MLFDWRAIRGTPQPHAGHSSRTGWPTCQPPMGGNVDRSYRCQSLPKPMQDRPDGTLGTRVALSAHVASELQSLATTLLPPLDEDVCEWRKRTCGSAARFTLRPVWPVRSRYTKQQPSRPYRAGHFHAMWRSRSITRGQLCQPGGRDLKCSTRRCAWAQSGQAFGLESMQDRADLIRPAAHQPRDFLNVPFFVGQQRHLAIGPLDGVPRLLVAFGHRGPRRLIQAQPYRRHHRQHTPGPCRTGSALYRNPCLSR